AQRRGSDRPTRARIVEAMIAEAGENGYQETEVETLLARAGTTRSEFERQFASKEECFMAAWGRGKQGLVDRCVRAYAQAARWGGKLRAAAAELLEFLEQEPTASRVLIVELLNAGPKGRARRDMTIRVLASLIDPGRDELADPDSLSYDVAVGVAGSVFISLRSQMLRRGPPVAPPPHSPPHMLRPTPLPLP